MLLSLFCLYILLFYFLFVRGFKSIIYIKEIFMNSIRIMLTFFMEYLKM